ncbi:sulfate ABC transporter substrate-binding protein [Aestuariivirga litoralis]|uniref:sulfate ABC transporter substrate-binding protein n=1 Tax=Aestuariivirga litoralis TaxID=2650924 RepID=UPI0018C77A37|nr:sulfate ABC transporter substrate-binding protein [Aestuariivirga litoralis]MBG1232517.1 sulfate ABC transporter substrate-binding protein [Aestuariivirga litoralis]
MKHFNLRNAGAIAAVALTIGSGSAISRADTTLLNVSYDPTRELYKAINESFAADYKAKTGENVIINQSHGGSGKQARAVIDGLKADVVTLALAGDIDAIASKSKLLPADWATKLPHNSTPFTSTIVFLVKKGNPKEIKDWGDLAKPGIGVITPNPKTSGGARWNFLAAWAWGLKANNGDESKTKDYIAAVYKNAPVLDTGARGSTTTFAERGIGDVLLAWETDAYLALDEFGKDKFDIVYPSISINAETPVAVIEENAKANGTEKQAKAYIDYLFSPPAQKIAAHLHYRPTDASAADPADLAQLPKIDLVSIDKDFGGWKKAGETFFADGAIFDQIYKPTN